MTDVAQPTSFIVLKYGGREYPAKYVPQCHVCTSPLRAEVEKKLLVQQGGYAMIARSLPEDCGLSTRNIQDHYLNGHMPLEENVRRVVVERNARKRGLDPEEFEGSLLDHISFAEIGLQKVFERLMSGEIEPDMKDGIALANFLAKVEEVAGDGLDQQIMMQAFISWSEAIKRRVDPETFRLISEDIRNDPAIKQLRRQAAIDTTARETDDADDE